MAFIKIDRKFFNSKYWKQKRTFAQAEAWIDLVQTARFEAEPETMLLANGREVNIKRGEIFASLRYLSLRWGWGVDKTRRFIDACIKDGSLARRIEQGESVLTLLNYEAYNPAPKQNQTVTSTATKHRPVQTKEYKELKEVTPSIPLSSDEEWKTNYDVYLKQLREAFKSIKKNTGWLAKQEEFYPKVDILKSIEKSCVNFWATEAGWRHKKKSKYKTIGWNQTFANSISQPQNKVYKTEINEQPKNHVYKY